MTRRLFGTLCGLVFLVNLGRVGFAPLVEPLMGAFGADEATLGLIVTLVWLGTAAARVPTGYVLTRVSRRRVVLTTGLLLAAGAVLAASAPSVPVLATGALVLGLASGAYFVAAVPLVGRLYPEGIGRAVGIHGTAAQLAAVVAPTIVLVVLATGSWRGVFWALAVAAVLVTLVLSRTIDDAPESSTESADRAFSDAVRAHWPLLVTAIILVAAAGFVWQGVFNFYPTYLIRAKGLSPGLASTLLTVAFAAGVPAFWFGGRLADTLPHVPYVLAIIAGFAGSLLVLTYTASLAGLVVVTALLGYSIHSLFPALDAFLLGSLPTDADASGYAVYSGTALFLEAMGSAAVGTLVGAGFGFETVFRSGALGLVVVLVALCVLYWFDRLPGARPAPDPERGAAPGRP